MDTRKYQAVWNELSVQMLAVMNTLHASLEQHTAPYMERFKFQAPTLETDAEDFFVSLIIADAVSDQLPQTAVDFKLFENEDGEGFNVGVKVTDIPQQTEAWGYMPYNYTKDCFTVDMAELERRVEDLPLETLVEFLQKYLQDLAVAPKV